MLALVLSCAFVACNKTEPDKEDVCEHVEVTDNAVEPTCTEKGLTEGTHCSKCGKILQAQNEIPALGHKYGDIIPKTEPTCSEKGVEAHYKCSVCNKVFKNDEHKTETTLDELTIAINPNAHNFGNWIKMKAQTLIQESVLTTTNIPKRKTAMAEPQHVPNKRCAKNVKQNTASLQNMIIKTAIAQFAGFVAQVKVLHIR